LSNEFFFIKNNLTETDMFNQKNIAEKGVKKRENFEKVEKKLKKGYHQLLEKKEVITLGQKNCI
jgi:hypothetical protein